MTVYIVTGGWDWEGFEIDSVHATREAANQRGQDIRKDYDYIKVFDYKVEGA